MKKASKKYEFRSNIPNPDEQDILIEKYCYHCEIEGLAAEEPETAEQQKAKRD